MTAAQPRGLEQHLEAHPSSPLFARLADTLLKNGEVTRAIDLCERGLKDHPRYTTGQLVYARCLAARGNLGTAAETLSRVMDSYPGNIVLEQLAEEWSEHLRPDDTPPDETDIEDLPVQELFAEEPPVQEATTEEPHVQEAPPEELPAELPPATTPVAAGADPAPTGSVEAGTETLGHSPAGRESAPSVLPGPGHVEVGAPPPPVPDDAIRYLGGVSHHSPPLQSATGFIERDRIISRTLAEIYASQGATREAIDTYRLLIERLPEKRETFSERLMELEEKLRSHPDRPKDPQE